MTTPARAIAESADDGLAQELLDGAVSEAIDQGVTSRRRLRHVAARLGPQAELGVERALQAVPR